jgi:hypothetical protein
LRDQLIQAQEAFWAELENRGRFELRRKGLVGRHSRLIHRQRMEYFRFDVRGASSHHFRHFALIREDAIALRNGLIALEQLGGGAEISALARGWRTDTAALPRRD